MPYYMPPTERLIDTDPVNELWRAARQQRAFLASTNFVTIGVGQTLAMTISNPADSGKRMTLVERQFGTDRTGAQDPLAYTAYVNPTAMLTEDSTEANLFIAGASSTMQARHQVGAGITMGGIRGSSNSLETNGAISKIILPALLDPGVSLGFTISGPAAAPLATGAQASITLLWYEEDL